MLKVKKLIRLIHVICAVIITLNYLMDYFISIRIVSGLCVTIKLVFIISGVALFILYMVQNKAFHKYYGVFTITSVLFGFSFVQPHTVEYEKERLKFYSPYQGFIQMCCPLELYESAYGLFEKRLFVINMGPRFNPKQDIEIQSGRVIKFKNGISEFDVMSQSHLRRDSLMSY